MRVGNETGGVRRRRWPRIAGWTLAGLAVVLAGMIYWRVALAEATLRAGLAAAGFRDAIVAIGAITPQRIRIARLKLGPELDLAGMTLVLDPGRLRSQPVASVEIGALTLDLTRPDGPLRRLLEAGTGDRRSAGPPLRPAALLEQLDEVPALAIDAWRLRLPADAGEIDLTGDALSQRGARGRLTATVALRGTAQAGVTRVKLNARAFLDAGAERTTLTIKAAAPDAGAALDLGVTLDGVRVAPTARGEASLRIAGLDRLASFVPQLAGLGGALSVEAHTTAPLPIPLAAPPDAAALLAALRQHGGLTATVTAKALSVPDYPPVDASAQALLGPDKANLSVTAGAPALGATAAAALAIADPYGAPKARLHATVRLGNLARLATLVPALPPVAGTLDASLATVAPVAIPLAALTDPAALDGLLRKGGSVKAALRADTEIGGRRLRGTVDARLDSGPDKATLALSADAPDAGTTGKVTLAVDDPHGAPKAGLRAEIALASLSRLAGFAPALAGLDGALRLRAETAAPVALPGTLPHNAGELAAALCRGARGSLALEADGVRRAGAIEGLSGAVRAALRCPAPGDAAGDIELKLAARRVTAPQASAEGIALEGPMHVRWKGGALNVELPAPFKLAAARIKAPAATAGPVHATLTAGKQPALAFRAGDLRPEAARLDLAAALEPLTVTLRAKDGPPVAIRLSPARLAASGGIAGTLGLSVEAARADVTRGDLALGLGGISAHARRPEGTEAVSLDAAARLDTSMGGKKLLAPLDLKLAGRLLKSTLEFDATATGPDGLSLTAKGRHALASGAGTADVALARLQFGPGGARLAKLMPGRKPAYAPRAGALEAKARLAWRSGTFDGGADVTVTDLTVSNPDKSVAIEGLATRLRFDRLLPPVTAPGQELAVRRIAAGAALNDVKLRFALRPGKTPVQPVVAIESLGAEFAGGTITGRDITFDPARAVNRAVIRVQNIDIEKLLNVAQVKGLSGTGIISGTLPVVLRSGGIAIDKGALTAAGPGTLHFKSDAAKKTLASGGKYVTLALEALEDFRYRKLSIEINKALAGEGAVLVHVEGHNPAVGDGQPFAINLNVSGNVDRLAAILGRLMLLPEEVVRSIVPKK